MGRDKWSSVLCKVKAFAKLWFEAVDSIRISLSSAMLIQMKPNLSTNLNGVGLKFTCTIA